MLDYYIHTAKKVILIDVLARARPRNRIKKKKCPLSLCGTALLYRAAVPCHCTVPLYRAAVPCRCTVPLYRAAVPRRCTVPLYHAAVPCRCTVPLYRAAVPCRCTMPLYRIGRIAPVIKLIVTQSSPFCPLQPSCREILSDDLMIMQLACEGLIACADKVIGNV